MSRDVRYWHLADILKLRANVRYSGKADIARRICTLRGLARPVALPDDRDAGRHNLHGGMP